MPEVYRYLYVHIILYIYANMLFYTHIPLLRERDAHLISTIIHNHLCVTVLSMTHSGKATATQGPRCTAEPAAISDIRRSAPWSPRKMWIFQLLWIQAVEAPQHLCYSQPETAERERSGPGATEILRACIVHHDPFKRSDSFEWSDSGGPQDGLLACCLY